MISLLAMSGEPKRWQASGAVPFQPHKLETPEFDSSGLPPEKMAIT